jgi:hypothetical protein
MNVEHHRSGAMISGVLPSAVRLLSFFIFWSLSTMMVALGRSALALTTTATALLLA